LTSVDCQSTDPWLVVVDAIEMVDGVLVPPFNLIPEK
jgi:hypothetical protein